MEKQTYSTAALSNSRYLPLLETITLLTLIAITFACVGPLLEEWSLFAAFNNNGVGYVATGVSHTMRPLHLIPYAMQWILGGPHHQTVGVAIGTAVLLISRYFAARWAVSLFLNGYDRWVISTMAATLVPWDGAWLGRYAPSQLSAVYFFLTLGCVIRLHRRWSMMWAGGCALLCLLQLATYQGLFLCLAVMPLALLLWRHESSVPGTNTITATLKTIARIYLVMLAAGALYGLYWFLISRIFGGSLYEENLAAGSNSLFTIAGIIAHLKAMIVTSYANQPTVFPLLLAVVFALCWRGIEGKEGSSPQWRMALLIVLCIALMPLVGLIYVNDIHLHDPERITFPLSAGIALFTTALLVHFSLRRIEVANALNSPMVVLILVACCCFTALNIRKNVVLQKNVLAQAAKVTNRYKPHYLVVEDMTGRLGDVYTLYDVAFSDALAVKWHENVTATICTPLSIDRIHPIANRFPIPSTQRCEALPELAHERPPGLLVTRWNNGLLEVVTPN